MSAPRTLSFEEFWKWVIGHNDCIQRAGTIDAIIYDDEDFHWHFADYGDLHGVQVIRGKTIVAEFFVEPNRVAYVQVLPSKDADEWIFELIEETEREPYTVYVFVMAHDYEEDEGRTPRRQVH